MNTDKRLALEEELTAATVDLTALGAKMEAAAELERSTAAEAMPRPAPKPHEPKVRKRRNPAEAIE